LRRIKDRTVYGWLIGVLAPFPVVALFYLLRFSYLPVAEFIEQSFLLKVHLKLIAIGIFFANLGLFYLFLRMEKYRTARGIVLSVICWFFVMLLLYRL
jgi:hypothetical protein